MKREALYDFILDGLDRQMEAVAKLFQDKRRKHSREDQVLLMEHMHQISKERSRIELLKNPISEADMKRMAKHMGKKMQSSVSDVDDNDGAPGTSGYNSFGNG